MRAREVLPATLVALAAACATQDVSEPAAPPPAPLDAPAPPPVERLESERAGDEELGLAEYERLLADKESRLRAAGVLLAARGDVAEEARADSRFAAPPPAAEPAGGAMADEDAATSRQSKSKRAEKGGAGRGASGPQTAPAPKQPTATSATREKKNVKYDATPRPAGDAAAAEAPASFDLRAQGGRCQTICELSAATCELEGKICDLAARHADDPRYGELCRRADDDCRQAAEACQRCSP